MENGANQERHGLSDLDSNPDSDTSDGSDSYSFTSEVDCPGKKVTNDGNAFSYVFHHIDRPNSKTPRRRRAPPQAPPQPRQQAKVKQLAEEKASSHVKTDVEVNILARIRKCLDRANHPATPEMEAKAALHMSSRLMAQYNVTQADVLAQATESEQQTQYAGQSTVSIKCTKDPFGKVISQTWVHHVAAAMQLFFDCKSYSAAQTWSVDWTFFGIAPNTVAAAIAFEMAHNLVLEWARWKKGAINSYCLGVGEGLLEMAKEEKRQEEREARKLEREALSARLKEEQLQRQKELDRLNDEVGKPGTQQVSYAAGVADDSSISNVATPYYDSSDHDGSSSDPDDDTRCLIFNDQSMEVMESEPTFKEQSSTPLDPEADFEVELQRILKRERSCTPLAKIKSETSAFPIKLEESVVDVKAKLEDVKPKLEGEIKPKLEEEEENKPPTESSLWASASQLVLFRATANKIAEEYLKASDTKLSAGRARVSSVKDYGAYEEGKRDSLKIDVKRRRLE